MTSAVSSSPLRHLDRHAVSEAARVEAKRRETYLPPVSVFRWWARRTEAVVGGILDAVAIDTPGPLVVADPFAGGGTIAFSAAKRGHQVYAQDVNPWAVSGLFTALDLPTPEVLEAYGKQLREKLADELREAYQIQDAVQLRTIRVRKGNCSSCGQELRLFPTGLISLNRRVDTGGEEGWIACPAGHVFEGELGRRRRCKTCNRIADPAARYTARGTVKCFSCRKSMALPSVVTGEWDVVLLDLSVDGRREIRPPEDPEAELAEASRWQPQRSLGEIPKGAETERLIRYGFAHWEDLYPRRQRHMMEQTLAMIPEVTNGDDRSAAAIELAVIGTAEFAGYASRWDPRFLKPYETIANHRFQSTTLAVEPRIFGEGSRGRGTVESRIRALIRASEWLHENLDGRTTRQRGTTRRVAPSADTTLVAGTAQRIGVPDDTFDLVLTDPPYHDDVQYAELAWLYQAWNGGIKKLDGDITVGPAGCSDAAYRKALGSIFSEIYRTLKPDAHLILSYANRDPRAWVALVGALDDAGFSAAGFSAVQSENETDHSKYKRRATTMDLLIDVTPAAQRAKAHQPELDLGCSQQAFLSRVGDWVLRIGGLKEGWETQMLHELRQADFLS